MSTTQTVPNITIQMAIVASTTTQTLKQCIATAINTGLKRNPGSGPPGGGGSPGGRGGGGCSRDGRGQPVNPNQYQVIPPATDVCMMGSLPAIFDGMCSYAKGFIKGVQKYLRVKLPKGLKVRLERFQVMVIVWEQRKMLPAGLR
jgi:hypothetical protein